MDDHPRPGSARINGGPWLPCRFALSGVDRYVDWSIDAVIHTDVPAMGAAEVEIAICDGVIVFGNAIVTDVYVRQDGSSTTVAGSGELRGAR